MMKKASRARREGQKTKAARGREVSKAPGESNRQKKVVKMQRTHLRIEHLCLQENVTKFVSVDFQVYL